MPHIAHPQPPRMRALLQDAYGGAEVFRIDAIERPEPGPDQVVLRVCAAALDRGTWHLMTGRPYLLRVMGFGLRRPKARIPGLDVSGEVVATGPNTGRLRVGDRVFGIARGSLAEYALADEHKLTAAPPHIALRDAAALGVSGLTALGALHEAAHVRAGDRVLVIGASGGVGTYAVQIARAAGARVTAVCSGAKASLVAALGAAEVIDHQSAAWRNRMEGHDTAYDILLDIAGDTPLTTLRRLAAPRGVVVMIGGEGGGDWLGVVSRPLRAVLFNVLRGPRFVPFMAREDHRGLERLSAMVAEGTLRPQIDRRVGLREVGATLESMAAGALRGKATVTLE